MEKDLAVARAVGRAVVIGTGLIGTSIALCLRAQGTEVLLADHDPAALRLAVRLGAGEPLPEGQLAEAADVAVLAVPPGATAAALLDAQKRGLALAYTDVASVKVRPVLGAIDLGCDLRCYLPGHPLAGRERSGPMAARDDLFLGRPWALCPTEATSAETLAVVTALARACGAVPLTVEAAEHDRAVALVSHAPHVVAAAMAARLGDASEVALRLAGQGVRDVTRIAAGDPDLWLGILSGNSGNVADVLESVAADLARAASALRASPAADPLFDLLRRGTSGRSRIPGKHGGPASPYAIVSVLLPDRPGELGLLFQAAGVAGVNIEDVTIEHSPGRPVGVLEISVKPEAAARLAEELRARGWSVNV